MIDTTRVRLIKRLADTYTYTEVMEVLDNYLFDEWSDVEDAELRKEVEASESILTRNATRHYFPTNGDDD